MPLSLSDLSQVTCAFTHWTVPEPTSCSCGILPDATDGETIQADQFGYGDV
jgi:hypothetical protein